MSFQIAYMGGGMLDKIRSIGHIDSGRFDAPYMPRFTKPYVMGSFLTCTPTPDIIFETISFDVDVELIGVATDTDKYETLDTWQVLVDNKYIVDQLASKKYPEGLYFTVAHLIPANTEITFAFYNDSSTYKHVWYHYMFLMDGDGTITKQNMEE